MNVPNELFSIKNVPVGCIILSAIALFGWISNTNEKLLLGIFAVTFLIGIALQLISVYIDKYNADKIVEAEKIKSDRQKTQAKHREKQSTTKLLTESQKTHREQLRSQRAQLNRDNTSIDNAWKTFRRGIFR